MSSPGSIAELIAALFWPADPISQASIGLLLAFAAGVVALVHAPLLLRMLQIGALQRTVRACFDEESSNVIQRQEVGNAFVESPLAYQWSDFVRRWQNAIAADPVQNASLPELSRAPVRLMDVLEEHPLIPAGSRRSLLPALPAIFLAAGLLGAFAGIVLALPGIGLSLAPPALEGANRAQQVGALMEHLGMALRIGLWGLLLSLGAAVAGRLIEGRSEALAESLDGWVQLAYGSISAGELATRTAHEQRTAISQLQEDVADLLRQVSGRPRPLVRSSSTAPGSGQPASALDQEAVSATLDALGERLAGQLDRTLAEHLAALRESLDSAALRGSEGAAGGSTELNTAVEHLVRSSQSQDAASRSLTQTADSVSGAADELRSGLDDFADVATQMRETSEALRLAAGRADGGQTSATRASERMELGLASLRAAIDGLGERLSDQQQSQHTAPAEAGNTEKAEAGNTDEAEAEQKGDRRAEPEGQGLRPTEHEPAAATIGAGSSQAPEARWPASEADTIPNMQAPTEDMIYAAQQSAEAPSEASPLPPRTTDKAGKRQEASGGGGTLSGLLRPTHHSGPRSDPPPSPDDFDPAATVALERPGRDDTETVDEPAAASGTTKDDGDKETAPRRRGGLFGRRK